MSVIIQSTEAGVCTLQMNRAEKLNALNREMYAGLTEGFTQANVNEDCRVIVVKGAPGIFTAGNDIGDFAAALAEGGGRFNAPFLLMQAMLGCEKPIVASVDGAAIGIGITLLFHCDLVYASNGASFHTPFADLGVCPEFGSSVTFANVMGSHRAAQMLLLGEPMSAVDAERFGLVNQLVDSEQLDTTVAKVAGKLAAKPLDALLTSRRLLKPDNAAMLKIIEKEGEQFGRLMNTDEFKTNLQQFLSKGKG
ncbi:MAG: enoyl-CoA hydratase-related protein [Pseudomonadota bacterium]